MNQVTTLHNHYAQPQFKNVVVKRPRIKKLKILMASSNINKLKD